jgi:hypothetical protein
MAKKKYDTAAYHLKKAAERKRRGHKGFSRATRKSELKAAMSGASSLTRASSKAPASKKKKKR